MRSKTLPEPVDPDPRRCGPRLGFLAPSPIIAVASVCLALVVANGDPGALDCAAMIPCCCAPSQRLKTVQCAVPARHRCLWPRRAVADHLCGGRISLSDRARRRGVFDRHRPHQSASSPASSNGIDAGDDAGDGRA